MAIKMLRVLALTTPAAGREHLPCVPDPHGADSTPQRRRTVGMKHQEVEPGQWAWVPTGKVEDIAFHYDILKALQDGDLLAADQATADAAGIEFDPANVPEEPIPPTEDLPGQTKAPGPLDATKNALRSLLGTGQSKTDEAASGRKDGE